MSSDNIFRYALFKKGELRVSNVILAEGGYKITGFTTLKLSDDVYCSPGMVFNPDDGIYYQDESYSEIYPTDPELI